MTYNIKNMQDSIVNQLGFSSLIKPGGGANLHLNNLNQSLNENTLLSMK